MNILITGSTGYIGKNLLKKLKGSKYRIFCLGKNKSNDDITEYVRKNRIESIVNLVGIIKEKGSNTFNKVHIDFLNGLLDSSKDSSVKLFIQISALGVGDNIDTKYFKTKEKAEELIKLSNIPYIIIRPSILFGKGDKSISFFLKTMKTFHVFPTFGGGKHLIQPVYIDDLTNLIWLVITNPKYENRVVEIAGPKTYMYKEMLKVLKKSNNVKALVINIPMFMSKLIAKLGNILPLPINSEELTMLIKGSYLKRRKNNSIIQITGTNRLEELKF